jgi:hypothetical protein
MKESQEDVRKAVLDFGNALGMSKETPLLLTDIGLHSTIKELAFKAFVINYYEYYEDSDGKILRAIDTIVRYCQEMAEKGCVTFDVNFIAENGYINCFDKFYNELHDGDIVDVQMSGLHNIYKREDGQLYFQPHGKEERVHTYFMNDMIKIDGKCIDTIPSFVYPEIPIVITKYSDVSIKGWRAEIADDYENYTPKNYVKTNFEDLSFHFEHDIRQHENDNWVFITLKDAIKAANYCNEKYLSNKAKIWIL